MQVDRRQHSMPRAARGGLILNLILVLVVLGLLFAGYIFFMLKWSYSAGERAGWVQKLSHKGWICKTWEGELSMVAMPGAAPEKFFFTVWDDRVAEEINKNMGRRVSLHYEEKIGIPTNCFGETRYFVTKVNVLEPQAAPLAAPAAPAPAAPAQMQATPTPPAPSDAPPTATTPPASSGAGSGLRLGPAGGDGAGSGSGSGFTLKPGS